MGGEKQDGDRRKLQNQRDRAAGRLSAMRDQATAAGVALEEVLDDELRAHVETLTRRCALIDEVLVLWDREDHEAWVRTRAVMLELVDGWMLEADLPRRERTSLRGLVRGLFRAWLGESA